MDVLTRLKEIVKFSGLSVRAFSIKCGISQTTLDKQVKGLRSVSLETIVGTLYGFPEISAEWLLRGEGDMVKTIEVNSKELERINKLNNVVETLQDVIDERNATIANLNERIKQLENQNCTI